jgi:hypothetical protein
VLCTAPLKEGLVSVALPEVRGRTRLSWVLLPWPVGDRTLYTKGCKQGPLFLGLVSRKEDVQAKE